MAKTAKSNKPESKLTLAQLWDDTDSSEASNLPSPGEKEARLNSLDLKKDPKKGIAVFAEYEVMKGDEEGKKIRQMYKLTDADGSKAPGAAFLKRDLELIGYDDIDGKKLEKTLKEISEEQPMVVIRVAENGQYTNAYLQGKADDDGSTADDEDNGDDAEIEVDDEVTFTDDEGDEQEGVVLKIKGDKATVKVGKKEHKVDVSDLTKKEEEEEETAVEIEVGDTVTFDDDGEELEGEVLKIKGDNADVKVGKKTHKVEVSDLSKKEEESETETETETAEIEEGDEVTFNDDEGDEQEGTVVKIKGEKATVKVGKKEHKVDLDDLTKKEEEEETADEPIAVGDKVKWDDDDGDPIEGEVIKIKGDKLVVKDEDGDKVTIDASDAEKVEED